MNAIDPGGAAAKDGRMAVGDQIVMVIMQRRTFKATIRAETSLWVYFSQSKTITTWVYNLEHPLHIYERKIPDVAITHLQHQFNLQTFEIPKTLFLFFFLVERVRAW